MRNRCIKRFVCSRSAFSLVEIMLALAIVAIGVIAIIGLIPQGVQASRSAADNTLAATIVHDDLNSLRLKALTTWPPPTGTICYDAAGTNQVNCASVDAYFREVLAPQPLASTPNSIAVVATVSWPAKSPTPINNITNFAVIANYQQ